MLDKLFKKEKDLIFVIAGCAILILPISLIGWGLISYGVWNMVMDR